MNTATEPVQGVFIVFPRSLDLKIHVLLAALAMAMAVASALAVGSTKWFNDPAQIKYNGEEKNLNIIAAP